MGKLFRTFLSIITLNRTQNFLGAPWLAALLRASPGRWKKNAALLSLSLSPHYFFRSAENRGWSGARFRLAEYKRNRRGRAVVADRIAAQFCQPEFRVMDYGCGAGFLARGLAKHVHSVVGYDISAGVVECARILNADVCRKGKLSFGVVPARGELPLSAGSIDFILCVAVFQHVAEEIAGTILKTFYEALKPGCLVCAHLVIDGEGWRTEQDWRDDASILGHLKWRFGLHCFSRSLAQVERLAAAAGFSECRVVSGAEILGAAEVLRDDLRQQHFCILRK